MKKKIVIIGGVAGGASCATRARRMMEEAEIIMIERGPYASFANCGLPYFIGGIIRERGKLIVAGPEMFRQRFNIDLRTEHEAIKIDREKKEVEVRDLKSRETYRESYTHLVLSPGAAPIKPPLPGIDLDGVFTLRDIPDTDAIDGFVRERKATRAVVVGGGYIGLEMAENLRHRGLEVTLVELLPQVFPMVDVEFASIIHRELRANGIRVLLHRRVEGFEKIKYDGDSLRVSVGGEEPIVCDLAILGVGVKPSVELARDAELEIGEKGGMKVNAHMQTNDPEIYAVGDVIETENIVTGKPAIFALAGPANRQGRIAADHIAGRTDATYRGSQGTAICKIFDLDVGLTGQSAASCKRAGIAYNEIHVTALSHAGYYPGASPVTLKVVFDPESGKLLGGQAAGRDGVDKRIDVLATALRAGMTVFDLEHLELAYAPPYGSAKDPVNMAGFAASNHLRGDSPTVTWSDIDDLTDYQTVVLDVRTQPEVARGRIENSLNIPLDDLRESIDRIPKDSKLLVHCAAGLRSYFAVRILRQKGYDAKNISGGFGMYQLWKEG